jgi:hypothetical protein
MRWRARRLVLKTSGGSSSLTATGERFGSCKAAADLDLSAAAAGGGGGGVCLVLVACSFSHRGTGERF